MSEQVERKLLDILHHPTESPYGNPIPGLDELGSMPTAPFQSGVVSSVDLPIIDGDPGVQTRVRRLAEPVQTDPELLRTLGRGGIRPGTPVRVSRVSGFLRFEVTAEGESIDPIELSPEIAAHIYVSRTF